MYVISNIQSSYYKISVKRMAVNISSSKPFFLFWFCCCLFSFLSSLSVPLLSVPFSALASCPPSLWGFPFLSSRNAPMPEDTLGLGVKHGYFYSRPLLEPSATSHCWRMAVTGLRDRLPLPVSTYFLLRSQAGIYLIAFSREGSGERWRMAFIISIKAEMKGKGICN